MDEISTTMTFGQWANLSAVLGIPSVAFLLLIGLGWAKNHDLDKGEMRRAMTGFSSSSSAVTFRIFWAISSTIGWISRDWPMLIGRTSTNLAPPRSGSF